MGFKKIRNQTIQALKEGRIQHEARAEVNEKNLLLTGEITLNQVIYLLKVCRGTQYSSSNHHTLPHVKVHVFKPVVGLGEKREWWYLKIYFLEPDIWFISVHLSQPKEEE